MTERVTLVIDADALERIRIDQGSLAVTARGRSEQRVPISRLLRVDVTGVPARGFESLLELAACSVPVTFFRRSGAVLAQVFHPRVASTALSHWLAELFTVNGESDCYRAWRENHLRCIHRQAGIQGGSSEQKDREHGQRLLSELRRMELYDAYSGLAPLQEGLVCARVGEQLLRFGVLPGGPAHARLARDLESLASRWLMGQTLEWLVRLEGNAGAPLFVRYLQSLSSNALDEWLHLILSRLSESAAAGALHHDTAT